MKLALIIGAVMLLAFQQLVNQQGFDLSALRNLDFEELDLGSIVSSIFAFQMEDRSVSTVEQAYIDFKRRFNRGYTAEEDAYRFGVFTNTYNFIQNKNAANYHVTLAINQFSDLTLQEFKALYLNKRTTKFEGRYQKFDTSAVPGTVDWVSAGAVTPIKNQGQCGSCWAFSTVGSTEGANFLSTKKLVSLSEQQIVDCSHNGGNSGCDGGDLPPAFTYVVANGLEAEATYPYTAEDGSCKYKSGSVVYKPKSYTMVQTNSPAQMAAAVAVQPLSVCIEADSDVFQSYSSGIIKSPDCGTELDHCVTLTGYTQSYWVIKNSWGTSWGQQGYAWIERKTSGDGICGIDEEPGFPSIN